MFKNESPLDFTMKTVRDAFDSALSRIDRKIRDGNYRATPIIDGQERTTREKLDSRDPSHAQFIVGTVNLASVDDAQAALESLEAGREAWRHTPSEVRAEIIRRAGSLMRERRLDLAALIVREAGKPWREADADVVEAIDFCDYYADQVVSRLRPFRTVDVAGEDNIYLYEPRGVAVVIAPWNFPLAIACGMTVAALVTGNPTVLKPAEQTSIIAAEFAAILLEAGVPPSAFAFLPGIGEIVGRALVESPNVDVICFTGSKAVGLEILRSAAEVKPGQRAIKKVIAEMGGKNAIIVDEDADLDETVKGVLYSAYGYAGQKCSACSRVIGVGAVYEPLVARLVEAAKALIVAAASDPSAFLGPVIDGESQRRIMGVITEAERSGKVAFKGEIPEHGFFVPPVIVRDVPESSSLWREEVFGPVLAIAPAADFDEALRLANGSQYALTGGLFSRSPRNIEVARRLFNVGNLYINRSCTGAVVCRQPFGGAKMSGVGSKAGGPDYLLQFTDPRCITENTMRRGFAPEPA